MLFGIFGCVGQCRPQVWTLVLHVSVVGFCNDYVMWFLMLDPFDSCRFCEWLQALFTSSLPCLTPVIMVLTCYTNIFLQHLLCPVLSLWPRRSSPQIICPQIICYICQLSHGDSWSSFQGGHAEGLGKGDDDKCHGCPQVAHWWLPCSCARCWAYGCPLNWFMWQILNMFFPVPATLWRMTNMIRLEINDSWNKLWQIH